jgi:hypothetical protein
MPGCLSASIVRWRRLLIRLYRPVAASARPLIRVAGTLALVLLTPLGLATAAALALPDGSTARELRDDAAYAACEGEVGLSALGRVSPGTVFAPLDLSPNILLFTPNSVVGTSHHRNKAGMGAVIAGFMGSPDAARATLAGVDARYLAYCPGMNELDKYARAAPDGLAAALLAGRAPAWLKALPTGGSLKLYAVD